MADPGNSANRGIAPRLATMVLWVVYFLLLCPLAFVLRGLGLAPFASTPDRRATTYWVCGDRGKRP